MSYYDYYQPEAYIPVSGVFIEKDLSINEEIEKMRLSATSSLLSGRRDVLVVASVSCIYGIGNPVLPDHPVRRQSLVDISAVGIVAGDAEAVVGVARIGAADRVGSDIHIDRPVEREPLAVGGRRRPAELHDVRHGVREAVSHIGHPGAGVA